jgi:hypothetical protein
VLLSISSCTFKEVEFKKVESFKLLSTDSKGAVVELFILLKNKWYDLTKKIETLNNERDSLEVEKNNFVSEMCKIIEKHQPKVENLLDQKTTNIGKATISSKLLENDSDDSDSSDSDDEIPIKTKEVSNSIYSGPIQMYPESWLDAYFNKKATSPTEILYNEPDDLPF